MGILIAAAMSVAMSATLAASLLATGPARAEEGLESARTDAFDRRVFGGPIGEKASACFARRYEARHLAQHPKQKVTAMKVRITAENHPGEPTSYAYRIGVQLRGMPGDFDGGSFCGHVVDEDGSKRVSFSCAVECDAGGLDIALSKDDKSALVRLDAIAVTDRKHPDGDGQSLQGGADDRLFRLDRVDSTECDDLPGNRENVAVLQQK